MGLFDYNKEQEKVYIDNLSKRHSDTGPTCTKCGSWAEWTTRPWCINKACENFCSKALAVHSSAKLEDLPDLELFSSTKQTQDSIWPLPQTIPVTNKSRVAMGVPPREPWPIYNPTNQGVYKHWGNFIYHLDLWIATLVTACSKPQSGGYLFRLEVPDKGIPLKSPPFAPGAKFRIMEILEKRPEFHPLTVGQAHQPMFGQLQTPCYTLDLFVDPKLPVDVCLLSIGEYRYRLDAGYSIYIDLESKDKVPPVNACMTVGTP